MRASRSRFASTLAIGLRRLGHAARAFTGLALALASLVPASAQITTTSANNLITAGLNGSGSFACSLPALNNGFTIEAWVRPITHTGFSRIADIGSSDPQNVNLCVSQWTTGRPLLTINQGGTTVLWLEAPSAVPLSTWSHIAGVVNSDRSAQLYINGQLVASGTASALPPATAATSSFIGRARNNVDPIFNGALADVRVWTTGRTQAQIQANMPVGSITGATTGLAAGFPFGSTGVAVLTDISGGGRHLTQSGTVTYEKSGTGTVTTQGLAGTSVLTVSDGTLFLNTTQTYTGGTVINRGALWLSGNYSGVGIIRGNVTVGPEGRLQLQDGVGLGWIAGSKVDTININGGLVHKLDAGGEGWGIAYRMTGGELRAAGSDPNAQFLMGGGSSITTLASPTTALVNGTLLVREGNPNNAMLLDVADGAASPDLLITGSITQENGPNGITKTGAGLLALAGPASYGGTTTISAGTLQVGNGGTTGSLGSGNVVNNANLVFNRSDNISVPNTISGTGSVTKDGAGSLLLNTTQTYTGGTFINGGTLELAAGGVGTGLIRGNVTVASGARLLMSAANAFGWDTGVNVNAVTINGGLVENSAAGGNGWGITYRMTGGELRSAGGVGDLASHYSMGGGTTVTTLASGSPATISGLVRLREGNPNNVLPIDVADGTASPDLLISASIEQVGAVVGITKTGAGLLALAGPASYGGTTTISAGTLQVGDGGTTGSLGSGNVVNNATLAFNRSDDIYVGNGISGTGTLVQNGTGTVTFGNARPDGGTLVQRGILRVNGIRTHLGNITLQPGTSLLVDGHDSLGYDIDPPWVTTVTVNEATVTMAGGPNQASSTDFILNGGRITGTMTWTLVSATPANNTASVSTLASATTSVIDANAMAIAQQSVTFDVADGEASPDLRMSTVASGTGGLVKAGAGLMVLSGNNTYTGTTTVSAGTLQVGNGGSSGALGSGNVVNNATLIFNRSDSITVANAISGSGTLTQQGVGTLVLAGANSYSGISTIASGTVQVGAGGSAGSLGSGNVVNNSALVLNRNDAFTLANVISGTGTLTVQGGGIATLTGANTYSGISTISAGTLQVGNGGTTGALGSGNVVNNGTLAFNRSDNITVANVVSGTGGLRKQGNGTVTLSAAHSFSGATEITGGTLALGASGTLGTSSGITISGGAALDVTARPAGLVVPSGRTLANTGGTATLRGNIDVSAPTVSMSFDGTNPSFSIVNGTLTLAANTPVQVAKTGSALTAGLYKVISNGSGGTVAGVVPAAVTVTGAGGLPTSLSIVHGELFLQVGTPVTMAIGNLAQSYNATPRPVTIATTPAGIATAVTYNGSTTVPTAVGTYAIAATVTASGFYGSASGSLVISKGLAIVRLGNLFQNYDGTARRVVALTEPSGLAVSFTYDGKAFAPTNQGIYKVVATVSNPNYEGSTNGVLRVRPASPGSVAATPQPPAFMNHQGFLLDNAGSPLGSPNPRNYDLVFRIFATSLGGSALWAEQQNVTLDQGRYSVMLGEGQPVGVEPWPALDSVLASGSGTARFLQVTVRGIGVGGSDIVMMPRYELLSQPYAFLARHAETADTLVDSNGVPVVRVAVNNVGVSVEQPNATFDVGGTFLATSISTPGNADVTGVLAASSFVGRGTIPLGGIVVWTGGTPPQGWALCDGRTVNGRRTPDLRSRFVVGQGQGAGLTARFVGQTGGEESVGLDFFNMGSHSHVFDPPHTLTTSAGQHSHQYSSHAIDLGRSVLEGYSYAFDSSVRAQWYETSMPHEFNQWFFSLSVGRHRHNFQVDGYTSETGGGQPHPNMPPYFVLAYIMRVQ